MTGPLEGPELLRGAGVAKMDCPRARPCLRSASAASAAARCRRAAACLASHLIRIATSRAPCAGVMRCSKPLTSVIRDVPRCMLLIVLLTV